MQKHFDITKKRLQKFSGEIEKCLYRQRAPVTLAMFATSERIGYDAAVRGSYRPVIVGQELGPLRFTYWCKVSLTIPKTWRRSEVHLLWNSSAEACVWHDGQPVQSLTGNLRREYPLTKSAKGSERITLYIEAVGGFNNTPLRQAEIAVFDREAWDLLWDFSVISEMANELPADSPRAGQALAAGNEIANVCDTDNRQTWPAARAIAKKFLAARNGDSQHNLSAIGHGHLDTAWLWPLAETKRKCYRTFSNALALMEEYPDYKFVCSQALQLDWMKTEQPALYARIKRRVHEGRFVPAGGTWIEPDCNLPSGESLIRQFLVGQRFYRREFGRYCREFWQPDVFGYSGQLPQIMRGAGIEYFLTTKLSWNQINRPSVSTLLWEGIDGSQVLTHFPPMGYSSDANVGTILGSVKSFRDHERARESYLLFGHGDGGGGPTREMLERLQRMKDVDGLPRIAQRTPQEFFKRCAADIKDPTVWVGELYLELHRGTYTTQARNKRDNRRSEFLLRDVEFLATLAASGSSRYRYPAKELARIWKLVLINQFHDILPGSSRPEVYADSAIHYRDVLEGGTKLREQALAALLPTRGTGARILAVNTLSAPRTEVVEFAGKLSLVSAPALGYVVVNSTPATEHPVCVAESKAGITLENEFIRAVIRRDGRLGSLFDKRSQRETIQPGAAGNNLVIFDDTPNDWDAWDVDVFHLEKRSEVPAAKSLRVVERHPLRVSIEVEYDLSDVSTLKQTIALTAASPRLDFANAVEWRERRKFLKVEFPVNIRSDHATYEIQFGHLTRPTHFNTSWDLARFEVSAHRWADVSEPGFGVALLNDCKYGYSMHGQMLRLSLLRAPVNPDAQADQGQHSFRYALLPHAGTLQAAGVIEEGYRFNVPMLLSATNAPVTERSFFQVNNPAVVIDTVKKAEDSDDIIIRLYESHGAHGRVRFTCALPVKTVTRCNFLEENEAKLAWLHGGVTLAVRPFQIVTLKLTLRR